MFMQTGFTGNTDDTANEYIKTMIDILLPVVEQGMLYAGEYAKGCGRDIILPEDVEYAIKYCAMCRVGQIVGSTMPEIYDESESDSDESYVEDVPPEECPEFVRYSGEDTLLNQINQACDRWNTWIPQSPAEEMLKNAINNNEHLGA
jgi:hypothetical protein